MRKNEINELSPENKDLMKMIKPFVNRYIQPVSEGFDYSSGISFDKYSLSSYSTEKAIWIKGSGDSYGVYSVKNELMLDKPFNLNLDKFLFRDKISLNVKELKLAVDKSLEMTTKSLDYAITLLPMPNQLSIYIDHPLLFPQTIPFPCKYEGQGLPISVNSKLLLELLEVIVMEKNVEEIKLKYNEKQLIIEYIGRFGKTLMSIFSINFGKYSIVSSKTKKHKFKFTPLRYEDELSWYFSQFKQETTSRKDTQGLSPYNKDLMKVLSRFMWKEDDLFPQCASFNAKGAAVSDRTKFIFIEGEPPYKGTFDINGNLILPENMLGGNLNDFDTKILTNVDFRIKADFWSLKKGLRHYDESDVVTLLPMQNKLLATNKSVDIDSSEVLLISDFTDLNLVDYQYTGKAFPMRFKVSEFKEILSVVSAIYSASIEFGSLESIELKFCFISAYSRQQRALVITFPSIFGKTNILLMPFFIRSEEYSQMYGTTYIEQYEKMFKEYVANALMSFKSKLKKL